MVDDPVPFLGFHDFKGVNQQGIMRDIDDINIEILGARHSDFVYNPNEPNLAFREVSRKTNLFNRDLILVAENDIALKDFLRTTPGIHQNPDTGVYSVNPGEYQSPFGDR